MADRRSRARPASGTRRTPLHSGPLRALGSGALRLTCQAIVPRSRLKQGIPPTLGIDSIHGHGPAWDSTWTNTACTYACTEQK